MIVVRTSPRPPPLDTDVAIETPEHIVFRHRVAGPTRRFLAFSIDLFLCYLAFGVLYALVMLTALGAHDLADPVWNATGYGIGLLLLVLFAVQWVYFAAFEAWIGATPGKKMLGLLVVTTTGRPIGFRAAALRNTLRAADALPVPNFMGILSLVGFGSMLLTRRFQRLGDLAAGTMVIVPEKTTAATPLQLVPPAEPHELAILPDHVSLDADEREAIELFLQRRGRLGRARELELAAMIAPRFESRFGVRLEDPSRLLALLYDRAANGGRTEGPPSSVAPLHGRGP